MTPHRVEDTSQAPANKKQTAGKHNPNRPPHRQDLMNPVLRALAELGGSASAEEIRDKVIALLSLPDDLATQQYVTKRGSQDGRTQLEYDLAWVRTHLKQLGLVENSARGVWALTRKGNETGADTEFSLKSTPPIETNPVAADWREQLKKLLVELTPAAFERLIQRVLREKGFSQVEITGRTGDGGVDGKGIAKINGILSFHVVFQCKRYKGSVASSEIRDFRGAMQGRADKGLFLTTGYFTRDAVREATRDGAIAIDLVDGEKLAESLKELELGVKIERVETILLDASWFTDL